MLFEVIPMLWDEKGVLGDDFGPKWGKSHNKHRTGVKKMHKKIEFRLLDHEGMFWNAGNCITL